MSEFVKIVPKSRIKYTQEEYIIMCDKKGLYPLGDYIDQETKVLHQCILCGKQFEVIPRSVDVKIGYGCRNCSRKDTLESFTNKMKAINKNIKIIGNYVNSKTKIECECMLDGYKWFQRPNDLLQGIGCPRCNKYERITDEQFKYEFYKENKDIELLSDYVNRRTPILCKCKKDGYMWNAYGYDLLHNRSGCRMCNGNAIYTTEAFIESMKEVDNTIKIIGKYVNNRTKIECQCLICNTIWSAAPANLKNNYTGCPNCSNGSKLEKLTKKYLDSNNIKYEMQKKYDELKGVGGNPLSYDFYLSDFNLLIECQGMQHNKPVKYFGGENKFKIQQEHDKRKKEYAVNNNIQLLEIWYYELNNIENIISNILNTYKLSEEQLN